MTASALADGRYADRFVLVVDDHELVGASIVLALTARGTAARQCRLTSTKGILDFAARLSRRGVVLLDLDLGFDAAGTRIDEIELVREFSTRGWRVLVLSAVTDRRRVAAAIAAGSVGFVAKAAPLDELLEHRDRSRGRTTGSVAGRTRDLGHAARTAEGDGQAQAGQAAALDATGAQDPRTARAGRARDGHR